MNHLKSLLISILLLGLNFNSGISQISDEDYAKISMKDKRLIIAPLSRRETVVDVSFINEYPGIQNPKDSLLNLIDNELQYRLRKHSPLFSIYHSTYKQQPVLSERILFLSTSDSFKILIPADSEKIEMNLKGRPQVEPDFILFLQIGSLSFADEISPRFEVILHNLSKVGYGFGLSKIEGFILENIKYVFWDNKIGKIAVYGQQSLYVDYASKKMYNKKFPFSAESKYIDLLARFILTKTPFASPDMPYYWIQ